MKYSQYHEIRELFETEEIQSRGYLYEDWNSLKPEKKADELNEILGIAALTGGLLAKLGLGAAAGLFGFNKKFRQAVISWGIKKVYLKKLSNLAEEFKKQATSALQKAYTQMVKAKNAIKKEANVDDINNLPDDKKKEVLKIEKAIIKTFNETIDRLTNLKTQQVEKKIDGNEGLKDSTKLGLKFTWETMAVEAKVALLADLMKSKVIESDEMKGLLDNAIEEKTTEVKKKGNEVAKQVKKASGEGERKEEGSEEKKAPEQKDSVSDDGSGSKYKKGQQWRAKTKNKDIKYIVEIIGVDDAGKITIRQAGKEGAPTKELSPKEAKRVLLKLVKKAE